MHVEGGDERGKQYKMEGRSREKGIEKLRTKYRSNQELNL